MDGEVWDTQSGDSLRTLRADRYYERLDITGLSGITDGQRAAPLAVWGLCSGSVRLNIQMCNAF